MKWSNLRGQQWGAATLPLWHDGEFYNTELKVILWLLLIVETCRSFEDVEYCKGRFPLKRVHRFS